MSSVGRRSPSVSNVREKTGVQAGAGRSTSKTQVASSSAPEPALTKVDYTCPLCMEEMDETDQKFFPCKCRYQICLWCFYHVRDQLDNKCPACRQQYENSLTSRPCSREIEPLNKDEGFNWCGNTVSRTANDEAKDSPEDTQGAEENLDKLLDPSNLEDMRIIQRNLVYVVGLSYSVAKREILSCENSFGKYGKILSMRILPNNNDTCSAFITYYDELSATKAIKSINGKKMFGPNVIRCSFGTNKYCNSFIRNSVCTNPNCAYVHEMVDSNDCISKSELINFHSSYKFALKPLRELKQNSRNGQEAFGRDKKYLRNKGRRPYAHSQHYNLGKSEGEAKKSQDMENAESPNLSESPETQLDDQHVPSKFEQQTPDSENASDEPTETRQSPDSAQTPSQDSEVPSTPSQNPVEVDKTKQESAKEVDNGDWSQEMERVENKLNFIGGIQMGAAVENFHSINFGGGNTPHLDSHPPRTQQEEIFCTAQAIPSNLYYHPVLGMAPTPAPVPVLAPNKEERPMSIQYSARNSHLDHSMHVPKFHSVFNPNHMYPIGGATPHNPLEYIDNISQENELFELEIKSNIEKMIEEDICESTPRVQERLNPLISLNSMENGQSFHSIFSNKMGQNCASNNRRTLTDVQTGIIQGIQNGDIRQQIKMGNSPIGSGISILRAIMPHANITIQGQ
ncbi:Not4hp/Mot2p [Cryptosporidium canis]|uniref:Not4hp/Mot2p n=1 Tax=Cryptosporidium canis TaxID=195482 RepID=A0A9D5DK72_9CRYT|nr:Not4hp/Mot2p [Cryptosporidium canis]